MTQEFLNESKLIFKECTREQQHILLDALLDGTIECWDGFSAFRTGSTFRNVDVFNLNAILRTKPINRLAIPWEHIKPEYRWAAMDGDGEVYIYDAQPTKPKTDDYWGDNGGDYRAIDFLSSIDTSRISWRDSLVERPADK